MDKDRTIEEEFEELDTIINKMENADVSLEESFSLYEEGMKLLKNANEKVTSVEQKIMKMNQAGEFVEM